MMSIITAWSNNIEPQAPAIDQAHYAQKRLGVDLFMKGLLHTKWSKIQGNYIRNENLPSNFNIIRWNKKVTEV